MQEGRSREGARDLENFFHSKMPSKNKTAHAAYMRWYRSRQKEKQNSVLQNPGVPGGGSAAIGDPVAPVVRRDLARFVTPKPADTPDQMTRNPSMPLATDKRRSNVGFKTALDLFRPFPVGKLASAVCPYCLDTRES